MATNTSNAIGLAKQFSPQEQQVYQQRLQGLQTNYNIFAHRDYNSETLAQGFKALGLTLNTFVSNKDEQDLKIAQALAPQAYKNNADRHKLTAVAMLANVGGYDLSDNPYAVSIIDKLRGVELNSKINADYNEYRQTKRLAGTAEEELQSYSEFYQQALDGYQYDNKGVVSNQYAFESGLHNDRLTDTQGVYNAFHKDKNEALFRDRMSGFTAEIDKLGRDWQYSKFTKEDRAPILMDLMTRINASQGHSADAETKLLQHLMETMASTGNRDVLNEIGEYQAFNGKPVKEIVSPSTYYDLANKYGAQIKNDQFTALQDELRKQTTKEGIDTWFKTLQENDPEKAKQIAPYIDGRKNSIEAEQRARLASVSKGIDTNAITDLVSRVANGQVDKPTKASELSRFGANASSEYIRVGLETASALLAQGNTTGYVNLLMDNVIGGPLRTNLTRQIKTSLANGKLDDSLKMGLHFFDSNLKKNAPQLLGDAYSDMASLNTLLSYMDEGKALETMANAYTNRQNKALADGVKSTVNALSLDANIFDTGEDTTGYYNFSINNTNAMYADYHDITETLMLGGMTAEQAKANAQAIIQDNYVQSVGAIYPSWAYNRMQTTLNEHGIDNINQTITSVLSEIRGSLGAWSTTEVTFQQDGDSYKFIARDYNQPGVEKVFTENDVNYLLAPY